MIRLVTEAKFHMDMHSLGIFIRNNDFNIEVNKAFLVLQDQKSQYIGEYSVLRRLTVTVNAAGLIAEALGELLLSPNASRYVHLEQMFKIVHALYWNATDYLRLTVKAMSEE